MLQVTVGAAKSNFFDRQKVARAADAATRRVLSRFGAFVRQRARTSIRKRRAVSEPGAPPSSHVGLLRSLIFFAYDEGRKSVVIGPALLRPGSRVPSLLEYGGAARSPDGKLARHRPRPFMRPAFALELERLPPNWANSIR